MNISKLITGLLIIITLSGCSQTNVVSSIQDPNKLPSPVLFEDNFHDSFEDDITFWKNMYSTYTWLDIVFYTPDTPEIIEVLQVKLTQKDSQTMQAQLLAPTIDKTIEVANKTMDELYLNILNISEIKEEIDLHYDYLNEQYNNKYKIEKDIGMTRGRKEFYAQRFSECKEYLDFAQKEFKNNQLPEEIAFLTLIESGCNPSSVSSQNAAGIFQMIPGTGRKFGLIVGDNVDERFDAKKETFAAIRYLTDLAKEFQSYPWAINAYHSGEGNLRKAQSWANEKYPKLSASKQYVKIIQEFPEDRVFNNEEIYFYGKNSARYTILFAAMVETYQDWLKQKENIYTPKWWEDISSRNALNIQYPDESIKTSHIVQSGETLSTIANQYYLSTELLKIQLDKTSNTIYENEKLIFSHPVFYTLGEYLNKKGQRKILENKNNFCDKNPSIINCKDQNLEEIIFPNNSVIYY